MACIMSRKEDMLLEERIEKIRRKNEEIQRRHLEVEADKQHAAKLNALVQPRAPTEDWTSGWSAPLAKPKQLEREVPESRQTALQGQQTPKSRRRREPNGVDSQKLSKQNGKCNVLNEGDGPPPDPVYNFLADSKREPGGEWPVWRGYRQGAARGRPRVRERALPHKDVRNNIHPAEYEAWRAERNRIDQDRINRQKTAEGLWRREWDNEKVIQDFEEGQVFRGPANRQPQGRIGNGRFTSAPLEQPHNGSESARSSLRVLIRGGRRLQQNTTSDDGEVPKTPSRPPPQGNRNICKVDGTLTISIANNDCPPSSVPLQRVRVKPSTIVGSGRVGPRQKPRVTYSSQSDDEQQSPQGLTRTVDNTTPTLLQSAEQTVRFNPASLRPPLPPVSMQDGSVPKKQRDDSTGSRKGRKRNMRGDYSKREECRADSTGSSRGNDSEGAGDESWEDVTTSGTESACETLEEKARKSRRSVDHTLESSMPGKSRLQDKESKEIISNEQPRSRRSDKNACGLHISDCSSCPSDKGYSNDSPLDKEKDSDESYISNGGNDFYHPESNHLNKQPTGDFEVNLKDGKKNGSLTNLERFEEEALNEI